MNTKLLAAGSMLIACACHALLFNISVIVFDIDPEKPRPVMYFFGPILAKSALPNQPSLGPMQRPEEKFMSPVSQSSDLSSLWAEPDEESNPFSVRPIRKPLGDPRPEGNQKIALKSTFDTEMETPETENEKEPEPGPPVNIVPYKPLRLQVP